MSEKISILEQEVKEAVLNLEIKHLEMALLMTRLRRFKLETLLQDSMEDVKKADLLLEQLAKMEV